MRPAVYVASRASIPERSAMWRAYRAQGANIISSWIDEAGEGQTASFGELWQRIQDEIARCDRLVFYAETLHDFPLKGALVEVGMAFGLNKPVWIVLGKEVPLDGRTHRPLGSWIEHPCVKSCALRATPFDLANALGL